MQTYSFNSFESDANALYDYFQDLRRWEGEGELIIEHFRCLFVNGTDYPAPEILELIYRLVNSEWADSEFRYVINRCCYIFINHWWRQAVGLLQSELEFKRVTFDLVALFQETAQTPANFLVVEQLRAQTRQFTQSPQYEILQRYARIAGQQIASDSSDKDRSEFLKGEVRLNELIHRYPNLYRFYIQDTASNNLGHKAVSQWQARQTQKFETDLFMFAETHLFSKGAGTRSAALVVNPTLLSESELKTVIQQFVGRVGKSSYRDSAIEFANQIKQFQSLRLTKDALHSYLSDSLETSKYRRRFEDWLYHQLREILSQQDHQKPRASTLIQTCVQLVEMIVANPDPAQPQKHGFFMSLHGNVGVTATISLLMKLLLLCQSLVRNTRDAIEMLKARTSKQFAHLFRHYENQTRANAQWLIECLDNLMVAFSIHFGAEGYCKWADLL